MKLSIESKIRAIGFCFAGLLAAYPAQASSFAFGYAGATVNQTGDYILGDNFNVIDPIQVTELGVFSEAAPIGDSISIGLYQYAGSSSSWTLLGSVETITSGDETLDPTDLTDFIGITPITLGPGLYSIVTTTSSDYNSGFTSLNSGPAASVSAVAFNNLGGAISAGTYDIWSPGVSIGSSLSGMQTTGPGNPTYPWPVPVFGAGTFSATEVPAPLPDGASTLMLLGAGFGALAGLSRRWRRA